MSEHSGYRDGSAEPPGPLADEAARLVGAAQDWWHRTVRAGGAGGAGAAGGAGGAGDGAGAGIATGSPECCWCPVCQAIATVRGDRPDILERLMDTQTALSGLLRALADSAAPGRGARTGNEPPPDQPPPDQPPPDGDRAPRIQRIVLNGDPSTSASPHQTAPDAADPEQDAP